MSASASARTRRIAAAAGAKVGPDPGIPCHCDSLARAQKGAARRSASTGLPYGRAPQRRSTISLPKRATPMRGISKSEKT
jgi:hypothetical protein